MSEGAKPSPAPIPPAALVIPPNPGETVTSELTGNTYTMGEKIGEGFFGLVYSCVDIWENKLAVKVLKGTAPYAVIEAAAQAEFGKLILLRHPYVTYVFDAFHLGETVYIVTERCHCALSHLFTLKDFNGKRLTNAPIRGAESVLRCLDDHKNRVVGTQATYACGSSTACRRVCEQRNAQERVLSESGLELRHTGPPSEERALETRAQTRFFGFGRSVGAG